MLGKGRPLDLRETRGVAVFSWPPQACRCRELEQEVGPDHIDLPEVEASTLACREGQQSPARHIVLKVAVQEKAQAHHDRIWMDPQSHGDRAAENRYAGDHRSRLLSMCSAMLGHVRPARQLEGARNLGLRRTTVPRRYGTVGARLEAQTRGLAVIRQDPGLDRMFSAEELGEGQRVAAAHKGFDHTEVRFDTVDCLLEPRTLESLEEASYWRPEGVEGLLRRHRPKRNRHAIFPRRR